jgi:signal transduction histidine kinase
VNHQERKFLHDLSTPLAALQLYLEGLREGMARDADPGSSHLAQLNKSLEILGRLNGLLCARREEITRGGDT